MRTPESYITFPLDVSTHNEAMGFVKILKDRVGLFKVGLELFISQGPEILKAIRYDERLAATRVIVATTHWEGAEEVEKEADLVILKPIGYEQLRDLASRFLPRDATA